ncbi:MAG: ABC transporter ATP-binding protein [Ilumatobacteraceae bacterium]|jgi:branched-chain amino acid transport system ATP-binding protein|nr:ABC transporter ATP-binding protein [Ilumatobacteraceae bacterium]MBJ7508937.1 ABC transporter ATP-binding protein [Ilumatobacteraceae bacterium]
MALLEIREVMVRFGGVMAVGGVDLDVQAGEITGLIGPNGAGKTTLFNVISGMQDPTAGMVSVNGVDISHESPHRRAKRGLARTFQRLELFASLTVRDNVRVAAELASLTNIDSTVDRLLEKVGVSHLADKTAGELPTGSARLVEIARALATGPQLLLLDEPASGLDESESDRLGKLLRELTGEGLGVLLVEHDMSLVMRVCDSIYVLDLGMIIAHGTPEYIQHDPQVLQAYLGAPS